MPRTHFHEQLEDTTRRVVEMSRAVEEMMEFALRSLEERDPALAQTVIDRDEQIDATEVAIEESCVELLALQQPLASDLRRIVAILKINNDLERVGDHAVNIAEDAQDLIKTGGDWSMPIELQEATAIARGMLRDSLDAFVRQDCSLARAVGDRDDRVDRLHESLIRSMLTLMLESPSQIGNGLDLILISRNVERVADLATNIAEDVVYLVEGITIRHMEA